MLTKDDEHTLRYPLGLHDSYIYQRTTGLTRTQFLPHLAGHQDFVRVDYLEGDDRPNGGVIEFAVSGTKPYVATSGTVHEQYHDYGSDVTIDPTGTSLTLGTYGYDPTYADDIQYVVGYPFSAASTVASSCSSRLTWGSTSTAGGHRLRQVSREDFVRLWAASAGTRAIDITYDAATG